MMFLKRNKDKSEKPPKSGDIKESHSAQINLKSKMAKSILLHKTSKTSKTVEKEKPNVENIIEEKFENNKSIEKDKVSLLIKKINENSEKTVIPKIDFSSGMISYPLLNEIEEDENNIEFLEKLASDSMDVLTKINFEKLVVCPQHPDSLSVNVRLYCPKCNSMDVEKLFLLEHSRCGFISEKKNFEHSEKNKITKCPSCKKEITDPKKELHIPAMWYQCNHCEEKFDNISIKLHCRNHHHDFDVGQSVTVGIPGFKIKDDESGNGSEVTDISKQLTSLLGVHGFEAENNYSIKGKSGHYHHVDLFGKNKDGKTIFIFIKKSENEIDNSEINSKIIQVLDTTPDIAILVGFATISEKAKTIAGTYNVSIVASQESLEITSAVEQILNEKLPRNEEDEK